MQDLVKRLAKSASFLKWNELNGKVKQLEAEVAHGGADAEVCSQLSLAVQVEAQACNGGLAEGLAVRPVGQHLAMCPHTYHACIASMHAVASVTVSGQLS